MLEPTPFGNDEIPNFDDLKAMWSELVVEPHPKGSRIAAFAAALGKVFTDGEVRSGSFAVQPHPVFDWFGSRNQLHQMWFFEKFWLTEAVHSLMSEPLAELNFLSQDVFAQSSPFMLGGSFAWALASGGAYGKHQEGSVHAKALGEAAAKDWINDRYEEVLVYESGRAWSEFFSDVAWDNSWVALDRRNHLVHVLIGTDTD